jgi:hypothetical protein
LKEAYLRDEQIGLLEPPFNLISTKRPTPSFPPPSTHTHTHTPFEAKSLLERRETLASTFNPFPLFWRKIDLLEGAMDSSPHVHPFVPKARRGSTREAKRLA